MLQTPFQGSAQGWLCEYRRDVMVPMRDGTCLATDLFLPAAPADPGSEEAQYRFPCVLMRTPYDKTLGNSQKLGTFFARRGYVWACQDVRGRFASEGEFATLGERGPGHYGTPFGAEAEDGYDAVEWCAAQPWCDGSVGTMGGSYAGSDQSALATLDPPHLAAMVIEAGASSYFEHSMRQNGALEQRFAIYALRMACDSPEARKDSALKARLLKTCGEGMSDFLAALPIRRGGTVLREVPGLEQWVLDIQEHGTYDAYWQQRGYAISEYYAEHADVPTLFMSSWYDTYPRGAVENFLALRNLKQSPQYLMLGPGTHTQPEVPSAGILNFGQPAAINYADQHLAFFDCHLKKLNSEARVWPAVRYFLMGLGSMARITVGLPATSTVPGKGAVPAALDYGGQWQASDSWPPPDTHGLRLFLQPDGILSIHQSTVAEAYSEFEFDPQRPVPTVGGSVSAAANVMNPVRKTKQLSQTYLIVPATTPM